MGHQQIDLFKPDQTSIQLKDVSKGGWRDSRSSNEELENIGVTSIVDIYVNGTLTTALIVNIRPEDFYDVAITSGVFKKRTITIHKNNVYLCYNGLPK